MTPNNTPTSDTEIHQNDAVPPMDDDQDLGEPAQEPRARQDAEDS